MAPTENELLAKDSPWREMGAERDPARTGFTLVHNYAHYFWRPYLGNAAFSLWELLVSYCYGNKDTAFPSLSHLARMLTNSDQSRGRVKGRKARSTRPGPLDRLRAEHLIATGSGDPGPRTRYVFRVARELPLLRPEQVATLSPALQRDHERWLERYGISSADYQRAYQLPLPTPEGDAPAPTPAAALAPDDSPPGAPVSAAGAPALANKTDELPLHKQWWLNTQEELKAQLLPGVYRATVEQTCAESFEDGTLTLRCRAPLVLELMQYRLRNVVLRELIYSSRGAIRDVRFV